MTCLSRAGKLCITAFIAILIMVSLFTICIYLPQQEEILRKHLQMREQQIKLSEINDFLKAHADSEEYKREIETVYYQTSVLLPDQIEAGNFLTTLQEKALLQNIQLLEILPGKAEMHELYVALPVQIHFYCTYFQLIDFLQSLETAERFFAVRSVNLHADSQKMDCKIDLVVYSSRN